jgi:hypothetical protein
MIGIRPLDRKDIPAVTRLTSNQASPSLALQAYFERTLFDDPWADHDIPSLVYEEQDGSISGFQGSATRRGEFDGRTIRIACGVTAVSRVDVRHRAVGSMLVRAYLAGPQDLTITDAATEEMRQIWILLGGRMSHLSCLGWVRIFRPWGFAAERLVSRHPAAERPLEDRFWSSLGPERPVMGRVWSGLDAATKRIGRFGPSAPRTESEPLSAKGLVVQLSAIAEAVRLHVAYDASFAEWVFRELAAVQTYGIPVARLVRDLRGSVLGWYVYFLKAGAASHVLQIAAADRNIPAVLDDLFHHAWSNGATAVRGRVEPRLLAPLGERRCVFRYVGGALVHSSSDAILDAIATGDSLLTRLDGEWWMGHYDRTLLNAG